MDLQRLINEVEARPAIWDQKNTHYHNRDIILRLWGEIAKSCDVSSDVAKSKWKHLRDNFRNELKKTYRGKSLSSCEVDGSSPSSLITEHESKWVWFKSLQFLRDQMNSRVIGGHAIQNGGHALQNGGYQATMEDGHQIEPQIDIVEGEEEAHFDDTDNVDSSNSPVTNDDVTNHGMIVKSRKRSRIVRKRHHLDCAESIDYRQNYDGRGYGNNFGLCRTRLVDDDDDTYHFLMSVRSPMRSLPIERQMYVRLKIQEIILNELTSMGQHNGRFHDVGSLRETKPHRVVVGDTMIHNSSPERAIDDNYFS